MYVITDERTDLTKLRYVLYARKSTEDESRQLRSIGDQIADCKRLAEREGLKISAIVQEKKSAKKPGRRPLFTRMLDDVRAGKYDAILCWHPDRLSRNMLESGMLIDMLDENILKDIRLHSHQFSNDPNGKMLLGMLFVFSKQYSDDLSVKVSRGVKGNFGEGKSSGAPKWGYNRDKASGLYTPNQYYSLVQQAWHRRAGGESVPSLVDFLILNGYERITNVRGRRRVIKPTKQTMGTMFQDPFYYGKLLQAEQIVDLTLLTDFEPMISEEIYNQVQSVSYDRTKDPSPKKRATFYPLRGLVLCAVCGSDKPMRVGKSKGDGGRYYLYYRCDNPNCTRKQKSLRAKYVFGSLYERLADFQLSDRAYERYSSRLDGMTDAKLLQIKREIQSHKGALAHITAELDPLTLNIDRHDVGAVIYERQNKRIDELALQHDEHLEAIEKLQAKIADPHKIMLSKQEFLNVMKTAADKMKAGSPAQKDVLARILFLNVHVDDQKVVDYLWNEPFATLVKSIEIKSGRGDRT